MVGAWTDKIKKIDPSWQMPVRNQFARQVELGAQAVDQLMSLLLDENATIRADAAEALGLIGDTRALSGLRKHLGDRDSGVRVNVVAVALIRVGDSGLFP